MSIQHTVRPGETLSSIARQYKLQSWQQIYWDDENEDLRKKRRNENLIFPGDIVMIPGGPAGASAATAPGPGQLTCDSKAAAIAILKASPTLDANTKALLSTGLIWGIIRAEAKRIGWPEWCAEQVLPNDIPRVRYLSGGQGPGQLYPDAHADVEKNLKPELNQFLVHMGTKCGAGLHRGCGQVPLTLKGYAGDVIDPITADFFIAGYLALRIMQSKKPNRSADDQLQFGIGLYSGARRTIVDAQIALSPSDEGKSVIDYQPVKTYLEASGDDKKIDAAAYIDEVYRSR
jgi:LysM domain-containing protein